ncbi:hypothetical protein B0H66DRAFT_636428 [Apodospora peruviana]|uniref:Uncharacterized protein n=1 Tax=Apodospora peruviana TaxID=516989 RepID=A0AAE0IHA0_9PEZI|nr:hypothetical protein B0H66DRAFT_636428 [Apodospora peruviana]
MADVQTPVPPVGVDSLPPTTSPPRSPLPTLSGKVTIIRTTELPTLSKSTTSSSTSQPTGLPTLSKPINGTTEPTFPQASNSPADRNDAAHTSTGTIVGVVVGAALGILVCVALVTIFWKRMKRRKDTRDKNNRADGTGGPGLPELHGNAATILEKDSSAIHEKDSTAILEKDSIPVFCNEEAPRKMQLTAVEMDASQEVFAV